MGKYSKRFRKHIQKDRIQDNWGWAFALFIIFINAIGGDFLASYYLSGNHCMKICKNSDRYFAPPGVWAGCALKEWLK